MRFLFFVLGYGIDYIYKINGILFMKIVYEDNFVFIDCVWSIRREWKV